MNVSSGRAKGRQGEHQAAHILGGKRAPLSGIIAGTGDVLPGVLWADWCVEVKRRKKFPSLVHLALEQARASIGVGDRRKPLALFREDRGRWMIAAYAEDLVAWVEALSEVAQSQAIKDSVRQIRRELEAIEGRL